MNITSKQDYDRELERLRDAAPKVPGRTYHSWGAMKAWMGPVDEYGRPYSEGTSKTYSAGSTLQDVVNDIPKRLDSPYTVVITSDNPFWVNIPNSGRGI